MKNNIILTFTLFFCIAIATTAQIKSDSQAIAAIDKAAAKLNTAYSTTVKMSIKEPDKDKATTENMDIKLSGNKFYLKTKDMEVFFDGKTQWVVFPELNEVSISNPTAKELQEISPVAIIKNYKNRYRVVFDPELTTAKTDAINLYPNNRNEDIFRIRIFVNKTTNELTKIESASRNGQRITFELGTYKPLTVNATTFTFNAKNYPKITVNDLR